MYYYHPKGSSPDLASKIKRFKVCLKKSDSWAKKLSNYKNHEARFCFNV